MMERSVLHYLSVPFKELAEINDDDTFRNFIKTEFKRRSSFITFHVVFLVVISSVLVSILLSRISQPSLLEDFFLKLGVGIFFGILLVPIHELIHGLYLKMIGASSVKFHWDIVRFRFGCYSDRFVMSKDEYIRFLLAPFVVITSVLLILAFIFSQFLVLFLAMIVMHSSVCAGDFALATFSSLLSKNQLYVYYDYEVRKIIFLSEYLKKNGV